MSWLKWHPPPFFLLIVLARFMYFAYSGLSARIVLAIEKTSDFFLQPSSSSNGFFQSPPQVLN